MTNGGPGHSFSTLNLPEPGLMKPDVLIRAAASLVAWTYNINVQTWVTAATASTAGRCCRFSDTWHRRGAPLAAVSLPGRTLSSDAFNFCGSDILSTLRVAF